jgi:membrane protein
MSGAWRILRRTGLSFYEDQMTHHAAALTYYGLMSLFPALLLGVSLLGLLGQYPETYNSIVRYLRDVVPPDTLNAIDKSLRGAINNKGTAATALGIALVTALYGTTGALEAARRALNVVFGVESGRSFLRRKARDIVSTVLLVGLVLLTLVLMFVGGRLAEHIFGSEGAQVWNLLRWPGAVLVAMAAVAYIYYVTPDLPKREFHVVTPGAIVGVIAWIAVSWLFSTYISNYNDVSAIYGTFAAAIVLVAWVWLTNVALLFGAELNAAIAHERGETVDRTRTNLL